MCRYITKLPYKVLCFIFVIMVFSCFSLNAAAETDNQNYAIKSMNDYQYTIYEEKNTIEIVRYTGDSKSISIPETIENMNVTSIGTAAFANLSALTSVSMPDTILTIEKAAFSSCSSLTQISLSKNLQTIGDSAFSDCTALKSLHIPDSTTMIGNYAFANCKGIESLDFSSSIAKIGNYAFLGCSSLSDITLSNSNTEFGAYALEGTAWLNAQKDIWVTLNEVILIQYNGKDANLVIPQNVQSVAAAAFAENEQIISVDFSKSSVNFIGERAFENDSNLESVILNEKTTVIKSRAFHNCSSLTNISLPGTLTELESEAFSGCIKLTSIEIPGSIQALNAGLFSECVALADVKLNEGLKYIYSNSFKGCESLGMIDIPSTVEEIFSLSFTDCTSLTRVIFEKSNVLISDNAFQCENLQEIVFMGNSSVISDKVFSVKSATVYCDTSDVDSEPMKFAKSKGYETVSINELPPYTYKGSFEKEETTEGFYSSYVWIAIIMIVIDVAVVILFSVYIMFFSRKKSKKPVNKMTKV